MAQRKQHENKAIVPTNSTSTDLVYPPKPATKEARIHYIMDLMADGKWVTGKTYRELAVNWGMTRDAVQQDSAEASRMIRALVDPEETRARVMAGLEQIIANCLQDKDNQQAVKNAIRGLEALGRVCGTPSPAQSVTIHTGAAQQVMIMLPPEKPADADLKDELKDSYEVESEPVKPI